MRGGGGGRIVVAGLAALAGFILQAHAADILTALGGPSLTIAAPVLGAGGGILGWLGLALLAVAVIDMAARRRAARRRSGPPPRLLQDIARALLFGAAALAILAFVFGQPVSGLVATSGVLVAVLGFALRNMISDVFSGIALSMEHPYRIGDWIEIAPGVIGHVAEINWRATRLSTRDDTSLVVPNGLIAGNRFINYSYPQRQYRANLRLALDPAIPVERAKGILLAAVLGAEGVCPEPRPDIMLEGIDERGVCYVLRYWVPDFAEDAQCRDAVLSGLVNGLQQAGLAPAFPRRDIAVGRRTASDALPGLSARLRRLPLLRDFTDAEIDDLARQAQERRFHEGERIVTQGEAGRSLFLLAEGALEVWMTADMVGPVLVDHMQPGDMFGEISLLTGQPRSASVIAATDGRAYEIRKEHLEPILRRRPELAADLAGLMSRRREANRERLAAARTVPTAEPADARALLERLRSFFGLS